MKGDLYVISLFLKVQCVGRTVALVQNGFREVEPSYYMRESTDRVGGHEVQACVKINVSYLFIHKYFYIQNLFLDGYSFMSLKERTVVPITLKQN